MRCVRVSIDQLVVAPYSSNPFVRPPPAALAVLAVAALVSLGVHTAFGLVASAAWKDPDHLEDESLRRRMLLPPPPPPIVVELDDTDYDARVADYVEVEVKKDAAPGLATRPAAVSEAPGTAAPAKPAQKTAPMSVKKQVIVAEEVAYAARPEQDSTRGNWGVGAPGGVGIEASASASAIPSGTASPSPSGSASASASAAVAAPGDDGTTSAEHAPDVVARFAKDLPRWGIELLKWSEVATDSKLEARLTIELDATGRVALPPEDPDGAKDALTVTIQRTLRGLFTKLALPDHPVAAGRVTVTVQATVTDGAPIDDKDIQISFSYTSEERKGRSRFVLKTGRSVVFEIAVVSVEVAPKAAPQRPAP